MRPAKRGHGPACNTASPTTPAGPVGEAGQPAWATSVAKLFVVAVVVVAVGVATALADPTYKKKYSSFGFSKYHQLYPVAHHYYAPPVRSYYGYKGYLGAPLGLHGLPHPHIGVL